MNLLSLASSVLDFLRPSAWEKVSNKLAHVAIQQGDQANETARRAVDLGGKLGNDLLLRSEGVARHAIASAGAIGDRAVATVDRGVAECAKTTRFLALSSGALVLLYANSSYGIGAGYSDPVTVAISTAAIAVLGSSAIWFVRSNNPGTHHQNAIQAEQLALLQASALEPQEMGALPAPESIFTAAYNGDVEKIKKCQVNGEWLETRDEQGRTVMHWACIGNKREVIEWLWYFGCTFAPIDSKGLNPLNYIDRNSELYNHCLKLSQARNRFNHERPYYFFYPPEGLIFKGGGAKGVAHVGGLKSLEEMDLLTDLKRVAGTSAGAITALLVGLGYSSTELMRILMEQDFSDFLDHEWVVQQKTIINGYKFLSKGVDATIREAFQAGRSFLDWVNSNGEFKELSTTLKAMDSRAGIAKGERFVQWLEKLIQQKTDVENCTFGEYRKKIEQNPKLKHVHIYTIRVDVNPPELVCLNSEEEKWDHVLIVDAVRASMSIPILFQPASLRTKDPITLRVEQSKEKGIFVDGGIVKNFPVGRFDFERFRGTNPKNNHGATNHQVLAFDLISPEVERPGQSLGFKEVIAKVFQTFISAEELQLNEGSMAQPRVVRFQIGDVTLVNGFFADERKKMQMINSAIRSMQEFYDQQTRLLEEQKEHDPRQLISILPQAQRRQPAVFPIPEGPVEMPAPKKNRLTRFQQLEETYLLGFAQKDKKD